MAHPESVNLFFAKVDIGTTAARIPIWMGFTTAKENTPKTWMVSPGTGGMDQPIP